MVRYLALVAGVALFAIFLPYMLYPPSMDWILHRGPFPVFISVAVMLVLLIAAAFPLVGLSVEALREEVVPTSALLIFGAILFCCLLAAGIRLALEGQLNDLDAVLDANQRVVTCTYALGGSFFLIEYFFDRRR